MSGYKGQGESLIGKTVYVHLKKEEFLLLLSHAGLPIDQLLAKMKKKVPGHLRRDRWMQVGTSCRLRGLSNPLALTCVDEAGGDTGRRAS